MVQAWQRLLPATAAAAKQEVRRLVAVVRLVVGVHLLLQHVRLVLLLAQRGSLPALPLLLVARLWALGQRLRLLLTAPLPVTEAVQGE